MRQSKVYAQLEALVREVQTGLSVQDKALAAMETTLTTSLVDLEQDREEFIVDVTHKIARVYDHMLDQQKGFLKTIQEIRKASDAGKGFTVPQIGTTSDVSTAPKDDDTPLPRVFDLVPQSKAHLVSANKATTYQGNPLGSPEVLVAQEEEGHQPTLTESNVVAKNNKDVGN